MKVRMEILAAETPAVETSTAATKHAGSRTSCTEILYKVLTIATNAVTWSVLLCTLSAICVLYVPKLFGTEPYIVLSGSMEPVIHTGSLAYITKTDGEIQVDDIIAYMAGNDTAVVHRVVGYGEDGYITKGDANKDTDMNEVGRLQVIGMYTVSFPNVGYLLSKIRSHVFHIGSFSMPAVIPTAVGIILLLNIIQFAVSSLMTNSKTK